jgi:Protein of unknown function (DUF3108)
MMRSLHPTSLALARASWLVLLVTCAACATAVAAPAPPAKGTSAPLALGGRPPLARPGEVWTYRLAVGGVEVAEYAVEVLEVDGKLEVRSMIKTSGVAALLKKVELRLSSTLDPASGRPLRFRSEERAGKGALERADARLAEAKHGVLPVAVRRGDSAEEVVEWQKVRGPTWDLNSVMVGLRQLDGARGSQLEIDAFRSRHVWRTTLTELRSQVGPRTFCHSTTSSAESPWRTTLTLRGRERVATELGTVSARRIDGRTYGLRRGGERSDDPERSFSVWISDDADRVPVLLTGVTDYGTIRMELTSYSPGTE